jgi:hypothetical protein
MVEDLLLRLTNEADAKRLPLGLRTLLEPLPFLLGFSLGLELLGHMNELDAALLVNSPSSAFVHEIL